MLMFSLTVFSARSVLSKPSISATGCEVQKASLFETSCADEPCPPYPISADNKAAYWT